jgi:hypothetical protein
VWTDVSAYAMRNPPTRIRRGFSRDLQSWTAGTCSFTLDNTDGRFSPTNMSGPYVSAGLTEIRPWRPVYIYATYDSETYPLFRGYALTWDEGWMKGVDAATVTVECTDELGSLARYDGFEQSPAGAGDTSGERVHRVLDNAGHTGSRNVDVGQFTMQATTLAQNAVSDLKLTADSEAGFLWIDADGTVVFGDQLALFNSPRSSTSQASYSDDGSGLAYYDLDVSYDGDHTANVVSFARAGGTEQTVSDTDSRALYRDKRYSRTDLICESDAQALALAQLHLELYGHPELRFDSMKVKPAYEPTVLYPEVLGRKILDRLTVARTPPGGDPISRAVFVSGVEHSIGDEWFTGFWFSSAEAFASAGETWDSAVWNVSAWS